MGIYEGNEKYIFISYAHKDSEVVLPIVNALMDSGFRVWYDQGIEAGTEWPAYIEEHLIACDRVVVFISPSSVDSINCRNEINLAATENKEMLIVYLEDTKLKHGLSLQIGARQSLFRSRHNNDKSFVNELLKAKILQSCRIGATEDDIPEVSSISLPPIKKNTSNTVAVNTNDHNDSEYSSTIQQRVHGPSVISRVGAMGSNNPGNAWPNGTYSQTISTSGFSTIHFHCNLLHPLECSGTRYVGIRIFDEKDTVVFENNVPMEFKRGDFRFSLGWVIKESNGFAQAPGNYSALIWMDDSRAYEFNFRIITGASVPSGSAPAMSPAARASLTKEIGDLEKKLAFPKVALFQMVIWFTRLISLSMIMDYREAMGYSLMFFAPFVLKILIFKWAKKITPSAFARLLLIFIPPINVYYSIYLVFFGLANVLSRGKNKKRLNEIRHLI